MEYEQQIHQNYYIDEVDQNYEEEDGEEVQAQQEAGLE